MSRWAFNATWHEPQGSEFAQNRVKRARHVAMGLQRDVARAPRVRIRPKGSKTSAPRRIGSAPCRDGPPIRRGTSSKGPNPPEREQNECATSHWECAMSRWTSNTTWHELQGSESAQKRAKRARHVALGGRHVVLGLQRDVARAQIVRIRPKESKTSAPGRIGRSPCRDGPPTRRGTSSNSSNPPEREQNERAMSHWECATSRWASNATWLPHARLHHIVTGTDKRWRNHFGSRRGGLYGTVGSVELVGVAGCGPIACFPYSWKLPSDSAAGHDLTKPTHRRCANRRLPYLPESRNVGRKPYNDYKSCPAANNVGSQYRLAEFGARWESVGEAGRG